MRWSHYGFGHDIVLSNMLQSSLLTIDGLPILCSTHVASRVYHATHAGAEGAGTVTLDSSTLTIGSNTSFSGATLNGAIFPAGSVIQIHSLKYGLKLAALPKFFLLISLHLFHHFEHLQHLVLAEVSVLIWHHIHRIKSLSTLICVLRIS